MRSWIPGTLLGLVLCACASRGEALTLAETAPQNAPGLAHLEKTSRALEKSVARLHSLLDLEALRRELGEMLALDGEEERRVEKILRSFRWSWIRPEGQGQVSSRLGEEDVLVEAREILGDRRARILAGWLERKREAADRVAGEVTRRAGDLGHAAAALAEASAKWSLLEAGDPETRSRTLEAWAEEYAEQWRSWAATFEEAWAEFAAATEEDRKDQEQKWEAWAREYERRWEDWARTYSRSWEEWGKQVEETVESGNLEDSARLIAGFFDNLSGLSKMPLDGLEEMPLDEIYLKTLAELSRMGELDWDGLIELIEDSVEGALKGLESLDLEDEEVRQAVRSALEDIRRASVGLRSSRATRGLELESDSRSRWEAVGRRLAGREPDEDPGPGKWLNELLRRRIEEITAVGDEKRSELVARLRKDQQAIEERERELQELRDEINAIKKEIERLRRRRK